MVDIVEPVPSPDLSWGSAGLDGLVSIFAEWAKREGFEQDDGDAMELLASDITADQRAFLTGFVVVWDTAEAMAGIGGPNPDA